MKDASFAAKKYFSSANIKNVQYVSPLFASKYKIVVFVPLKNADELTFKMAAGGAGNIGKYSICSFRTKGVGTFLGGKGSNPAIGKKGRFEMTEEIRLEMICNQKDLEQAVNTVYQNHPYEEPVCEIYPVIVKDTRLNKEAALVHLKKPVMVKNIIKKIKPGLSGKDLPQKMQSLSVGRAFIDLTGKTSYSITPAKTKTIVIKKNKNIINFEVI